MKSNTLLLMVLLVILMLYAYDPYKTPNIKVYASLTSTPIRLDKTEKTLKSLLKQSYPIEAIFINIPVGKHQSSGQDYYIPEYLHKYSDKVIVTRCPEYGPATKLLGSIPYINDPNAYIYVVDDDIVYGSNHLRRLVEQISSPENVDVVTNRLCGANRIYYKGVCGNTGFIVKRKILNGIYDFYHTMPKSCRTVDDMWFGVYFHKQTNKIKNAPISHSIILKIKDYIGDRQDKTGLSSTVNKKTDYNKKCMEDFKYNI